MDSSEFRRLHLDVLVRAVHAGSDLVSLPLEFLGRGEFIAEIYSDAPDAAENPQHTTIEQKRVNAATLLKVKMAPGGGQAILIRPAQ